MSQITTSCILLCTITYFYIYLASGLKCELKGFLNNKMQCLLHDRGINAEESAPYRNGSRWLTLDDYDDEKVEPWKYSAGLDRNRQFARDSTEQEFKNHVRKVVKGTRWCGDVDNKDIQLSYEDLVFFLKTDKCCKIHVECNETMGMKQSRDGLINRGLMRRYGCNCESQFLKCLKDIRNILADKIGYTYFTIFGPQCFRMEHPIVNCSVEKTDRCLKYLFNRTEEKKHQWFDIPLY